MSEKAFSKVMRGLKEAQAYMEGEREEHPQGPEDDPGGVLRQLRLLARCGEALGRRPPHPGGPRPGLPHRHPAQPVRRPRGAAREGIAGYDDATPDVFGSGTG